MPKLELKAVQAELDQGLIRPFYWIWGPELLKGRELLKRIRKLANSSWGEENLDGVEVDGAEICDLANSLCLGGGVKLVVVRDAHQVKNPEGLADLFGPPVPIANLTSVCVCLAKDLDARKKFSKLLIDQAAVVACEEVAEDQRESWITYLAKREGLTVSPQQARRLASLDPWSLDLIAQELDKLAMAGSDSDSVVQESRGAWDSDEWVENFFSKNRASTLARVGDLAENLDQALPLLGLLGWQSKQLAGFLADSEFNTNGFKSHPMQMNRLRRWSQSWRLAEVIELQHELFLLDWSFKQTPLMPLGLWSSLVCRFCPAPGSGSP